ncbi:MAG: hypothetical protein ACFFDK_11750 [Promethearchaeota archaeon]
MDRQDKEKEIEKLSKILSSIQNLYYKKKEQLDELQLEITELKEVLTHLNSIVSNKSFHSADELYHKTLDTSEKEEISVEDYFQEEIPVEKAKGTKIKRKIFSKDDQDLLCVLNFTDFNQIEIKFIDPETRHIKETSEEFISIFLRGALIPIKEKHPELKLKYIGFKNSDIIEKIQITNITSINDYDLITDKIRELLFMIKSQN